MGKPLPAFRRHCHALPGHWLSPHKPARACREQLCIPGPAVKVQAQECASLLLAIAGPLPAAPQVPSAPPAIMSPTHGHKQSLGNTSDPQGRSRVSGAQVRCHLWQRVGLPAGMPTV